MNRIVVIASRNQGKVREFAAWFAKLGLTVRSLADYGDIPDIVEDGATFQENALIKARTVAGLLGVPVLADDSGLTVDALGGAPGVYSARYAGQHGSDEANNQKLLAELARVATLRNELGEGHPPVWSRAAFVCALALADPASGTEVTVDGTCEGYIIGQPRGSKGFGYDPLFYVPELGRTFAELDTEEKNRISHRAQATRKLVEWLGNNRVVGQIE